ncbi:DUF6088 family protein [Brevundimonas sp. BR2-1]|uniref:DUF6088 family protein n=1 Tax=Brevundimonas sp. BR2-1 TaxID=3031123 RepID=UPI0030A03F4C
MQGLADQIMERASTLAEGAPIAAKSLLHLGTRAAVDQALSRLVRRGRLIRAGRGVYMCSLESRFGSRTPSVETVVRAVSEQRGEVVASNGAAAANALGLTTQAPIRMVYLTNGRSRTFSVGKQTVEFQHAPAWQLLLADRPAGEAARALAWLGPDKAGMALETLKRKLGPSAFGELVSIGPRLPTWLARAVSQAAQV